MRAVAIDKQWNISVFIYLSFRGPQAQPPIMVETTNKKRWEVKESKPTGEDGSRGNGAGDEGDEAANRPCPTVVRHV
jgi:hypothetical protein